MRSRCLGAGSIPETAESLSARLRRFVPLTALLLILAAAASAQVVTEFSSGMTAGAQPTSIVAGPDGNLWFTEFNGGNQIGQITTAGVVTEFSTGITGGALPYGIAAGPTATCGLRNAA